MPELSSSPTSSVAGPSRASTSTLLNGRHAFPPFYACYLLRSRATVKSNRTYVGSTPDPPRRLRQHNGELTQGAVKTSRFRPWEMQVIVYGFPSKLTALQFEWAWQKPEQSRHLRRQGQAMFAKDSKRNHMDRKIRVMHALMCGSPFAALPLHIRCFTVVAHEVLSSLSFESIPRTIDIILDLGGVSGTTGVRDPEIPGVTSQHGPIDVQDEEFRANHWRLWQQTDNLGDVRCRVCSSEIDINQHLSFGMCPHEPCGYLAHLHCLAPLYTRDNRLLPVSSDCPGCRVHIEWGQIIRGCFARRQGVERQASLLLKQNQRSSSRRRRKSPATSEHDMDLLSIDTLAIISATKKRK